MEQMRDTVGEMRNFIRELIEKRLTPSPCSQEYVDMLVGKYIAEIAHKTTQPMYQSRSRVRTRIKECS